MATKPIQLTQAIRDISRRILAENLPLRPDSIQKLNEGLSIDEAPGMDWTAYVKISEAFSIEGTLIVEFRNRWTADKASDTVNYELLISLSWPASSRSVVQALASINIYQKLTNLGAALQCMFAGEKIVSKLEPSK